MTDTRSELRRTLAERFGEEIPVPDAVQGLEGLLRMAAHTTHREWADTPVGPELVRLLAACALSAPSKSFLQQADLVDVRDPALRDAVVSLVPSMPWMRRAPALLVFCGNGRRFRRIFERRGQPFTNEHLDAFFNPAVDAALVLMNFIRAADEAGLVCCPISLLRDQPERLAALLAMPDHVFPVAGLCIGYPVQSRAVNPRLPLAATLHTDRFDDRRIDALTDDFDRRYVAARAAFGGPDAPAPASWSDERARQYATAQRPGWGAFVRSRGFDVS
jgi:nitroreductase